MSPRLALRVAGALILFSFGLTAQPSAAAPVHSTNLHRLWIVGARNAETILVVGQAGLTLDGQDQTDVYGPAGFGGFYIQKLGTPRPAPDYYAIIPMPFNSTGDTVPVQSLFMYRHHLSPGRYVVGYLGHKGHTISVPTDSANDIWVRPAAPVAHGRFMEDVTTDLRQVTVKSTFQIRRPTYVVSVAVVRAQPFLYDALSLCFRQSTDTCWHDGLFAHGDQEATVVGATPHSHVVELDAAVPPEATEFTAEMDDALVGVPIDRTLVTLVLD